jgi:hypothetical protein
MNGDIMVKIIEVNAGMSNIPGIMSKRIGGVPKVQSYPRMGDVPKIQPNNE